MEREDVTFREVAAWLYRPGGASACVVMGHGLSAVRDQRLPAYAERFAAAGLAVLLFDYRHFGASGGEPRQLLDIGRQLEDWRAAIGFARRAFPRVGAFGSSFGGAHVLQIGSEDAGLGAIVSQCPMTDGLLAVLKIPPLQSLKLSRAALQDQLGALAGRRPKLIPAAGRPGEVALMTSDDSLPGMEGLTPAGSTWVNAASARIGLRIPFYRPGRRASRIAAPLLVCACEHDSVVSVGAAEKVAERAPRGEFKRYPIGHFEIYVGEWFERAVADQTEFLLRHFG